MYSLQQASALLLQRSLFSCCFSDGYAMSPSDKCQPGVRNPCMLASHACPSEPAPWRQFAFVSISSCPSLTTSHVALLFLSLSFPCLQMGERPPLQPRMAQANEHAGPLSGDCFHPSDSLHANCLYRRCTQHRLLCRRKPHVYTQHRLSG